MSESSKSSFDCIEEERRLLTVDEWATFMKEYLDEFAAQERDRAAPLVWTEWNRLFGAWRSF